MMSSDWKYRSFKCLFLDDSDIKMCCCEVITKIFSDILQIQYCPKDIEKN